MSNSAIVNLAKALASMASTLDRLTYAAENALRHAPYDLYNRDHVVDEDNPPMWFLELQSVVAIAREALQQENKRFHASLIAEARK